MVRRRRARDRHHDPGGQGRSADQGDDGQGRYVALIAGAPAPSVELVETPAAHPQRWAAGFLLDDLDDAATVDGTQGELAIAGSGAPLVAEFCIADFALAVGSSTDAGRSDLGDAVEVRHRLPRLWARAMAGDVAIWWARRIADRSTSHFHACNAVPELTSPCPGEVT